MRGLFAWVASALIVSSLAAAFVPVPTVPESPVDVWEAHARGDLTIRQVNVTYTRDGQVFTLPVGFRLTNARSGPVSVTENVMLMSPLPGAGWSGTTTQDGALTPGTVPADGVTTYYYADEVVQGYLPDPKWWCTEAFQYTRADVTITLGGEILPFDLEPIIADPYHTDSGSSQDDLWARLKEAPELVVGKTPLVVDLTDDPRQTFDVTIRVTNVAVYDLFDGMDADVNATGALVRDVVPANWTVVPGSYNVEPDNVLTRLDGSTEITWQVDVAGADVTGHDDVGEPTPYPSVGIRYTVETPRLDPGRFDLPRGLVDFDSDGDWDAHSAEPLAVVTRVNDPPIPMAGGPYLAVEGGAITFDASDSSDPDGDPLEFRWDLDGDGVFDTPWSPDPTATRTFADDASGTALVEVSDGEFQETASAFYVVLNAAPVVESIAVVAAPEGGETTVTVTFSDAGWLDSHLVTVDWGDGTTDFASVSETNEPPRAVGEASATRVYGDDYDYPVVVSVVDDDGGVGSLGSTAAVQNLDPEITEIGLTSTASFSIRVAGEKWHDVRLEVFQGGDRVGEASVVRTPGSPDEQQNGTGFLEVDLAGDLQVVVTYTPEDDPVNGQPNGANPAWLIVGFPDGDEVRIHHTFNVQHPDTWVWTLEDALPLFVGRTVTLRVSATDPGSDDLQVTVDWGDGAAESIWYRNDGVNPDPRPSPAGTFPFAIELELDHVFATSGEVTLTLTVRDDDGGSTAWTATLRFG